MVTGMKCRPVVLVHGWNSHPGVWNRLVDRLEAASIPSWRFDHSAMADTDLAGRAAALRAYVREMRDETGFDGVVDVVCHSIGACIARECLEVADGTARTLRAGKLVMLGPPNNGSALAELFSDPCQGSEVIDRLTGVFVPRGFEPLADPLVQDVRPESRAMRGLRSAGIRDDIAYRVVLTGNPLGLEAFFPWFDGRTWELDEHRRWRRTLDGDGVVAHSESVLPGVPLEVLAPGPDDGSRQIPPHHFCHIQLPRNPAVIDRVMGHLIDTASEGATGEPGNPNADPEPARCQGDSTGR
jgi:triacylglycerol lipase